MYREIAEEIRAFQMTKENQTDHDSWPAWLCMAGRGAPGAPGSLWSSGVGMQLGTRKDGVVRVSEGDWIIRETNGDLVAKSEEAFEILYEEAPGAEQEDPAPEYGRGPAADAIQDLAAECGARTRGAVRALRPAADRGGER